jgi:hypothetical protein
MADLQVAHFVSYGFMHHNLFWCEGEFTITRPPKCVTNVEKHMSFDSIFYRLLKCSNVSWDLGYYKIVYNM